MGKIRRPPKPVVYIPPETEIPLRGTVVAQEQELEVGSDGEYMRVLELIEWEDGREQLRFGYYYRKKGAGENDWIWAKVATNIMPETLRRIIVKAKSNPRFKDTLKGI